MGEINKAEFVVSSYRLDQCPETRLPEYAFIGRSNVGKSSLINMLTGRKSLAKTSSTPGKTLLINHFLINDSWFLVDLPGYGYAKRSKKMQEKLEGIISKYILEREQLTCLFLLIDVRHEPQKIDLEFIEWLGENGVPFAIVFTKGDKLAKTKLLAQATHYMKSLEEQWEDLPPYFVTSSETRLGREELLAYIEQVNSSLS
jgi:GTP-binding protein